MPLAPAPSPEKATCLRCSKQFTRRRGNQRYCSPACSAYVRNRRYYATPNGRQKKRAAQTRHFLRNPQLYYDARKRRIDLYAQGLLDSLGADRRLRPGHSQGDFEQGRYRWTLDIERFQPPIETPARGDPYADPNLRSANENLIYRVLLQMHWGARGAEQNLRVETLRAYAPPQGGAQ